MGGPRTVLRPTVRLVLCSAVAILLGWAGWRAWLGFQAKQSWEKAESAFRAGRYATALAAAQEVLRARAPDPEASLLAARCLMRLGRGAEAEPFLRRAGAAALPDLKGLARALLEQGRTGQAVPLLREILRLDPRDVDAARSLTGIHQARGEYALAEELASRLVKDPESELVGQALLGTIHQDLATRGVESPATAIQAFERVLQLDPDLERCPIQPRRMFWDFLARDLIAEGRAADARRHLEKALAGGDEPGLLDLLGQAHWAEGRADQAGRCWERALALDPSRSDPWIGLGQIALREGRAAAAVRYLTRARELSPNSVNPLYKLIQAHRRLGQHREADEIQQRLDALRQAGGAGDTPAPGR
jgi:tetratricopeptide (TPR) repeat protein